MTLKRGYYVINGDTREVVSGPHTSADVAEGYRMEQEFPEECAVLVVTVKKLEWGD